MISTGNIKNILINDLKANEIFGQIQTVKDVHDPVFEGKVSERIVVVIPGGADNGQLERAFPRVCIYVPKIKFTSNTTYYRPDNARLTSLENECMRAFRSGIYGKFEEEVYVYKLEDIEMEDDPETWSNFLNVRLRFEVVNTKL